ncbi:MAG: serine hydrolase [Actinomycetes bacterium]
MSRQFRSRLLAVLLLLQLIVAVSAPTAANASVGSADDRLISAPTSWWTYTDVTPTQVTAYLSTHDARITDIQVTSSAPTFTVTMVRNTGAYNTGWWWYYGLSETQVNSQLVNNNARPINLSAYSTTGGVRYAVVMVSNTGTSQHASWWYHGSATFLNNKITANSARLTQLSRYPGGGYVAIMVGNTGTDARSWWWYHGVTATAVNTAISMNSARLVDVSRNGDGTFNVVMYRDTGTRWYWYFDLSPAAAVAKANQLGERIIDATSYTTSGKPGVAVVMTENLNALSQRLFDVISPAVDSGSYGFYLKQFGGKTLAGLQQTVPFEPAGTLALLYHAKSIHEESLGNTTDATVVTYHYSSLSDPNDGSICPDDTGTTTTSNLKNADTLMMQNSDYRMSRGILEKYTKTAVLKYANSLGMKSTSINRNIGCPSSGTPNQSTLADLGKMYEAFQQGTVTSNATWQSQFKSRMLNDLNYSGFKASICPIVNQEATALGKSAAVATSFCDAMSWLSKGGHYEYSSTYPTKVSWSGISLTGVPFKSAGVVSPRYYVFGEELDGTTVDTQSEADSIAAARSKLYQEALRGQIRAALATW